MSEPLQPSDKMESLRPTAFMILCVVLEVAGLVALWLHHLHQVSPK